MPVFQASGLASGLDTLSIIDALADAQRAPIRQLQRREEAYNIQLSALANLRSAVEEFKSASEALKTSGVVGNTATENSDTFSVSTTPDATAGNYQIAVAQLATPPKWRSWIPDDSQDPAATPEAGSYFSSATDVVKAGTLKLTIEETLYEITIEEGDTLQDVADAINAKGAPVSASIIDTGAGSVFLSIAGKNPGYRSDSDNPYISDEGGGEPAPPPPPEEGGSASEPSYAAHDALWVEYEVADGAEGGIVLGGNTDGGESRSGTDTLAQNALFVIDEVKFTRRNNEASDVIPGVTLTLESITTGPAGEPAYEVMPDTDPHEAWSSASVDMLVRQSKSMLLTQSVSATQENMQRWVDAYNGVNGLLQADLNIQAGQDRTRGLSGDPSIKALQRQLRELIIEEIPSLGNSVRTLADIGLKTANNGSISFDTTALERALKKDPSAINGLFQATDGLTESIDALVDRQLSTNDGTFDVKRKSIEKAIRDIQDQVLNKEAQIEKFKESMTMRFTAMEQSVGASKSMGDYLKNVKFPGFSKGS